jgi:zinc protease
MAWHFNGHVYGRNPLQALETLPAIEPADLKRFVERYFVPGNLIACISGDLTLSDAVEGLENVVRALPTAPAPQRQLKAPQATSPVLAFINKPGQAQAQVSMLLPGIPRTDPDYWKTNLLMSIFGGSDSLLYTRLRDDLGLVYSAGFYQNYKWKAGFLVGWMGSRGDMTARAISEAVDTMNRLRQGLPPGLFELKKLDALNSFVFNVDTPEALLGVYGRYYLRGEPLDTLDRIQEEFIGASRESLVELAHRFLDPAKLQIFVTGDRATLVRHDDGRQVPLDQELKMLAGRLGLPYEEIALR